MISETKKRFIEMFPMHCGVCCGRGGRMLWYPGVFVEAGEWDWCESCVGEGKDPLNVNVLIEEEGVSPTTGDSIVEGAHELVRQIAHEEAFERELESMYSDENLVSDAGDIEDEV